MNIRSMKQRDWSGLPLLICSALELSHLAELKDLAEEQGLDVLIEVHNETEMEQALTLKQSDRNKQQTSNFITSLDNNTFERSSARRNGPINRKRHSQQGRRREDDCERGLLFPYRRSLYERGEPWLNLVNLFPPALLKI